MIIDIIQTILDKSSKLEDQLHIMQTTKLTYKTCFIYTLITPTKMTNATFRQKKYSKIKKLVHNQNLRCSKNINSVNHLADTLEVLICVGEHWIRQRGIKKLKKLRVLDCGKNNYIRNVNHLANTLEELYCGSSFCGIEQDGISKLKKLRIIECCVNERIKNLNHLKDTLEFVDCSGGKIVEGLRKYDCHGPLPHEYYNSYRGEKEVHCAYGNIKQDGISQLANLKHFNCSNNQHIYDVNHMADSLEILECCGEKCKLGQDGISRLKKLKILDCSGNPNVHKNI